MAEATLPSSDRPVPLPTKLGLAVIAFGLVFDLSEHSFSHANEAIVAGFPLGEHLAHLVVIVGMVLVLGGIVADGIRITRSRPRPERSERHADR